MLQPSNRKPGWRHQRRVKRRLPYIYDPRSCSDQAHLELSVGHDERCLSGSLKAPLFLLEAARRYVLLKDHHHDTMSLTVQHKAKKKRQKKNASGPSLYCNNNSSKLATVPAIAMSFIVMITSLLT